jgi:hypothetical protein
MGEVNGFCWRSGVSFTASASQVVVFFGELVPCPASQLTERNSTVGNGCISRGSNK